MRALTSDGAKKYLRARWPRKLSRKLSRVIVAGGKVSLQSCHTKVIISNSGGEDHTERYLCKETIALKES